MFQQFLSNSLLQISQADHCVFSVYLACFLVAFWNLLPRIWLRERALELRVRCLRGAR